RWCADDSFTNRGFRRIEDDIGLVPTDSYDGALYFPYLKTIDPITGDAVPQPPSGFVAGVMARTDATRGVWKAPAGPGAPPPHPTGGVGPGEVADMRQGAPDPPGGDSRRPVSGRRARRWGART